MAGVFKTPDRPRVLAAWGPRVGDRAALALYRHQWIMDTIKWVVLTSLVLVAVAVHTIGRYWSVRLAWLLGALCLGYAATSLLFYWRFHVEAGRALGTKVTGRNAPPLDYEMYLQWCRRNEVLPLKGRTATTD